ncbi:MAG: hypothetical protein ACREPE_08100 [Lysobacter sp.]
MVVHRWTLIGLLGVAGLALWLLVAGPAKLLGVDAGNAGMVLLIGTAWSALYAISRMPGGEIDQVSPGEWKAWAGLGFMLIAMIYFVSHLQVFAHGGPWDNPDANRIGRNLVMLLIAWTVLSSVLKSRWQGAVQEDERDRQIDAQAKQWGYSAISVYVVAFALMLGFSPADRLEWATHFMIGNLLVLSLMWACLFEYAAKAVQYARDRQ